jgi:predicted DNA binding CopG/RHH family protein
MIRVRIEEGDMEAAQRKARRQGIPLSELIRRLLREWVRGRVRTPSDEEGE